MELHGVAVRVMVLQLRNLAADFGANSKLLVKFALQGFRRVFSRLDLPAGKLPFQRQRLIFRPLAAQDFVPSHNERSRHLLDQGACLDSV